MEIVNDICDVCGDHHLSTFRFDTPTMPRCDVWTCSCDDEDNEHFVMSSQLQSVYDVLDKANYQIESLCRGYGITVLVDLRATLESGCWVRISDVDDVCFEGDV